MLRLRIGNAATLFIMKGPCYMIPNYIKSSRESLLEFTNHINGLQDSGIRYQNFYAKYLNPYFLAASYL